MELIIFALPLLVVIGILYVVQTMASSIVESLAVEYDVSERMIRRISTIVKWLLRLVALVVVLNFVGGTIAWASLTAVLSAIAVAFFAMWSILSNVTSAILLITFRQIKVGDHVEVIESGGETVKGKIVDISLFSTTVEEDLGSSVRIPNNFFFQRTIRLYDPTQVEIEVEFEDE